MFCFLDLVIDVVNFVCVWGKDMFFLKVIFGEKDGMEKVLKVVKCGLNIGCWVIFENCYLVVCWFDEFMYEIEVCV